MDTSRITGGVNYVEASIELRRVFDSTFTLNTGPVGVEACPELKVDGGTLMEYWIERYDSSKIFDKLHISFLEFIKQPSHVMESQCRSAERLLDKDIKALNDIRAKYGPEAKK